MNRRKRISFESISAHPFFFILLYMFLLSANPLGALEVPMDDSLTHQRLQRQEIKIEVPPQDRQSPLAFEPAKGGVLHELWGVLFDQILLQKALNVYSFEGRSNDWGYDGGVKIGQAAKGKGSILESSAWLCRLGARWSLFSSSLDFEIPFTLRSFPFVETYRFRIEFAWG